MNKEHMEAGSERNKRQGFTIDSVQGQKLLTTEFKHGNLVLGILGSHVGVARVVTGIWKGLETYQ